MGNRTEGVIESSKLVLVVLFNLSVVHLSEKLVCFFFVNCER